LSSLSLLNLNDNHIEDVAPLAKRTQACLLLIERNKIADLGPLVEAAQADAAEKREFAPFLRLYVHGNPLSEMARTQQMDALKAAGVKVFTEDSTPAPVTGK